MIRQGYGGFTAAEIAEQKMVERSLKPFRQERLTICPIDPRISIPDHLLVDKGAVGIDRANLSFISIGIFHNHPNLLSEN